MLLLGIVFYQLFKRNNRFFRFILFDIALADPELGIVRQITLRVALQETLELLPGAFIVACLKLGISLVIDPFRSGRRR